MNVLPITTILLVAALSASIQGIEVVTGVLLLLAVAAEAFADRLN